MEKTPIILLLSVTLQTITADIRSQKCCSNLGCFDLGYPWSWVLRPVPSPQCPDECPAKFYLFSRPNTSENYTVSGWPIESFNTLLFNSNRTTVLYIRGWGDTWDDESEKFKDIYLRKADVNFIFLDWSSCSGENYLQAVSTLRTIAAQAVRFIRYLTENHGMNQCKLHIIGFSLGAHAASYIARNIVNTETNISCVERLTGLEPAAPLFQGYNDEIQIGRTDAKFVEIAHTETFPIVGYGEKIPRGHVDHYFNDNLEQPGCFKTAGNKTVQALLDGKYTLFTFFLDFLSCGHSRAVTYYMDSLKDDNCTFWGERINRIVQEFNQLTLGILAEDTTHLEDCTITSCSPFGMKAIEYPARGSFFVATNRKKPYCIPEPKIDNMMAELLQEYKEELSNNRTTDSSS